MREIKSPSKLIPPWGGVGRGFNSSRTKTHPFTPPAEGIVPGAGSANIKKLHRPLFTTEAASVRVRSARHPYGHGLERRIQDQKNASTSSSSEILLKYSLLLISRSCFKTASSRCSTPISADFTRSMSRFTKKSP